MAAVLTTWGDYRFYISAITEQNNSDVLAVSVSIWWAIPRHLWEIT
jgi:hypothetical protein